MKSIPALLVALLWIGGCHRQPRMATLPPPKPTASTPKDALATLPEPPSPQDGVSTPSSAPLVIGSSSQPLPPPTAPSKKVRRTRSAAASIAPVIQPSVVDPVSQPNPPVLGQMLDTQEHAIYKQKIDDELNSARRNLAAASVKNLDQGQKATARQIQTFIDRAEELRKSDVVAAEGLSRKADLLARDLFARVGK